MKGLFHQLIRLNIVNHKSHLNRAGTRCIEEIETHNHLLKQVTMKEGVSEGQKVVQNGVIVTKDINKEQNNRL